MRDRSSCPNLLCLREQSCSPDAVTFFKGFFIFVERGFNLLFKRDFELTIFKFILGIFDEGREGTSMTCIYLLSLSLLCVLLHLPFGLESNATMWQAPGHLNSASMKVNLRVVFFEPTESKDHALFP